MFAIEVHEDKEAAGTFDERCNGGAVERPTDEVSFQWPGTSRLLTSAGRSLKSGPEKRERLAVVLRRGSRPR